jgi:hypothetical protein
MLAESSNDDLPEENPLLRELLEMRARREAPTLKELTAVRTPAHDPAPVSPKADLRELTEVVVVQASDPRLEE